MASFLSMLLLFLIWKFTTMKQKKNHVIVWGSFSVCCVILLYTVKLQNMEIDNNEIENISWSFW